MTKLKAFGLMACLARLESGNFARFSRDIIGACLLIFGATDQVSNRNFKG
jgi:hypothetical protein